MIDDAWVQQPHMPQPRLVVHLDLNRGAVRVIARLSLILALLVCVVVVETLLADPPTALTVLGQVFGAIGAVLISIVLVRYLRHTLRRAPIAELDPTGLHFIGRKSHQSWSWPEIATVYVWSLKPRSRLTYIGFHPWASPRVDEMCQGMRSGRRRVPVPLAARALSIPCGPGIDPPLGDVLSFISTVAPHLPIEYR